MKQLFQLGLLVAGLGFFAPDIARGQNPIAPDLVPAKALNQRAAAQTTASKYCIKWSQTEAMGNPANLIAHWDYIETLPFDGVVILLPRYQFQNFMSAGLTMTYQQTFVDSRLSELSRLFKKVKHNYLLAWCDKPGDFYDDAAYARVAQNFAVLAKAARNAGLAGVVFDDEQYRRPVWDYPTAVDHAGVYSLAQYRAQARLRGKQIMEAMLAEFPDLEIIVPHGPYWSEPSYNLTPNPIYDEGELLGSFFLGFVEASIAAKSAGHSSRVIDGGELYKPRTVREFEDSYQYRKRFIASAQNNSATIPPSLRPLWADNVSVSFGLFNLGNEAPMSPSIMRSTMERAARRCDDIVWLYTEGQDWYTPGAISQDWIDAVRDGFQAGGGTVLATRPAAGAEAALAAYPNPSPDGRPTLRLTAPRAQAATVLVVDALGRTRARLEQSVPAGPTNVALPRALPTGLYFLHTTLDGRALRCTLHVE